MLYVPTFYHAAATFWQSDGHAHGPVILAILVWLVWRQRATLFAVVVHRAPAPGFALLLFGLLLYVVGRSQEIALFEIGSLAPILAGTLLAMRGWAGWRALWFPILFVAFMLPLPEFLVSALTAPLKQHVSEIADQILYAADYPIARNGVMLSIGQYQLLVADACSGLQSMFSLSALGVLYVYLTARAILLHNVIMLISILPIAFAANIVRVTILILLTYHFGEEAGQGFVHGLAGMVLFVIALMLLFAIDGVLRMLRFGRVSKKGAP